MKSYEELSEFLNLKAQEIKDLGINDELFVVPRIDTRMFCIV